MRQAIRNEVATITPFDALEERHRDEVLAWIDSGAPLCRTAKPATPPRHLVSYFVCVDGGHVLLVDHKNAQLWLPSGGHVEPDEHPRDTVLREAREELHLEAEFLFAPPLMITCTETVGLTAGHTDVSLWYVLRHDRSLPITFDVAEFNDVQWFPFAKVALLKSDPHMGRFLDKLVLGHDGLLSPA